MNPLIIPLPSVLIFLVVLARMGGLVTFAPFWSHKAANPRARILLALAMAFVITPVVAPHLPTPPSDYVALMVVMIGEVLIGLVFGFVGRLIFSGLELAAELLGFQMGLSLVSAIDPSTQARSAALATFAQMFGLMILLASDGHHWLLQATVRSFGVVAPGNFTLKPALIELILRLSADALAVGVALAAPAIIVLLVVEFALAIAGRAAPQLQIMVVGFPIKIAVGLWLIGATLYFMPGAVRTTLTTMRTALGNTLNAL
jgi:flagellar biosynthetic protein FliR